MPLRSSANATREAVKRALYLLRPQIAATSSGGGGIRTLGTREAHNGLRDHAAEVTDVEAGADVRVGVDGDARERLGPFQAEEREHAAGQLEWPGESLQATPDAVVDRCPSPLRAEHGPCRLRPRGAELVVAD